VLGEDAQSLSFNAVESCDANLVISIRTSRRNSISVIFVSHRSDVKTVGSKILSYVSPPPVLSEEREGIRAGKK